MKRSALAFGVVAVLAGAIAFGCGGGSTMQQATSMGSVTVFGGDAPVCDVVSFTVTITSATLTPQGGGNAVTLISSSSPVTVDFAALMDFFTVLNFASVPAGTYSQLNITLSNPQLTVLDVTQHPPAVVNLTTTLTSLMVTKDLNDPLTVPANGSVGLDIHFNLRKSVQTDAQGQVTGVVNPMFRVRAVTALSNHEDVDELEGTVQSVSTTSSEPSFIGSFVVKTNDGQTVTVQVKSQTELEGVSGLGSLAVGTFVEVEAFVDDNHNVVAKEVEVEQEEQNQSVAFVGLITAVTQTPGSKVTQFNMFVREEDPDDSVCVPPKSNLLVNVSDSTAFRLRQAVNDELAGLSFDATHLGLGQHVVVHGVCQAGPPATVNADGIFLRVQTILGNFSSLLSPVGSDGKTGGFMLTPCGAVFQGQPITVFTFGVTEFRDVTGLAALTPTPMLAARGLLLYEQQSITVNNISVTPPAPVFEALVVHQLE